MLKHKAGTVAPWEYDWRREFGALDPSVGRAELDIGKVYGLARAYAALLRERSVREREILKILENLGADRERGR